MLDYNQKENNMPTLHEWLNINSIRKYPFSDNAESYIPNNMIVDLSLLAPQANKLPAYVASIYLTPAIISVMIKDSSDKCLGIASGQIGTTSFFSIGIDAIEQNVSGNVTFCLEGVQQFVEKHWTGKHSFNLEQTALNISAVTVTGENFISSLGTKLENLYGDVKLEAGQGIKLDYNLADNAITIELEDPELFVSECRENCNIKGCSTKPILNINGVTPNSGNITLEGDGIVTLQNGTNFIALVTPQIQIHDLCKGTESIGPKGDPGTPGGPGPTGGAGLLVCGEADCCCMVCDEENIEECDNFS